MGVLNEPVSAQGRSGSGDDRANPKGLREKGVFEQERVRSYLGCDKALSSEYDFAKGDVRFEYKWSRPGTSNQEGRKQPTRRWTFNNLWGHGSRKKYDYLILEGGYKTDEWSSEFFCVPVSELDREKNFLQVTYPNSGRLWGVDSKLVWKHKRLKEALKSWCDQGCPSTLVGAGLEAAPERSGPRHQGQLNLALGVKPPAK